MLAVAGLGLVLLFGLVALVEGGRDSSRRRRGRALEEPWK